MELIGTRRYALFTGSQSYPKGGMEDYAGSFHTLQDAKDALPLQEDHEWGNIGYLTDDGCLVWVASFDRQRGWRVFQSTLDSVIGVTA